ncbi:hypothetical protein K7X08_028647 [Anisodus acutangulus]|uniref:Uncharacterized protein n=1 Tax=Anisodus acutangulus TaxID=402998 RepID=A0A9Q1LWW0_9SOLA|nr:hypothetical protein K7X08_028647 [Anisodus acutangulus]
MSWHSSSSLKMLYDIPSPLLNAVVEEALTCLKCAEVIKFTENGSLVYMQEVNDEEQALYARLMTRSPVALEAIVDGGRAMYNINGKHVWARKYVKKTNPKINFDDKPVLQLHPLQTNVSV